MSPKATYMCVILFIISWFKDCKLLRECHQHWWKNLAFITFNEDDCLEYAKMSQTEDVMPNCQLPHACWSEMSDGPHTCGDACAVALWYGYNTFSHHCFFFAILGGVNFTYVATIIRLIYTCPFASGMHLKPPPEVVCVFWLQSVLNAFQRPFTPGLFVIW